MQGRAKKLIEGNSWMAKRRKATFIQIPEIGAAGPLTQILEINHDELNAVLDQDMQYEMNDNQRSQKPTEGKI